MSIIQVTASQLRNETESLQGLNQELRQQITELELREAGMLNMWEGQAKEAFHAAFLRDKEQMQAFQHLVNTYIQTLLQIARKYELTEAQNAEIAAKRAY